MGTHLFGAIPYGKNLKFIEIFGYSTKGIPGVEIIGLKGLARPIKEKFVFISKMRSIQMPLKRYVLCVESSIDYDKFTEEELRYLEFPLLLLYWSLAGVIQLGNLSDCLACGRIDPMGVLRPYEFSEDALHWLAAKSKRQKISLLALKEQEVPEGLYKLPIEEVMSPLYNLDRQSSGELDVAWS